MIEVLGIKMSYDALAFLVAFTASELVGLSKLRENSLVQLVKSFIDSFKPARKEDEKVAAVKAAVEAAVAAMKALDD
jgi:hypothetical protein